ncbi:hypothetical protein SAMN05443429_107113 [Cruoricaptor ignavus]|uniref:Uncharacterized protein n=1 Tax=Cruoricaptor ignavus TaxID=1118202 RepID=A0A1M6FRZ4_9FLAO|nr:hypothetical protein [Cruoricaptor ignavus]SHJ00488.1 hypothetical protein SAMN05443429_107113 [Cruoricaptor ignavus]
MKANRVIAVGILAGFVATAGVIIWKKNNKELLYKKYYADFHRLFELSKPEEQHGLEYLP